jgi:hypothetical protein
MAHLFGDGFDWLSVVGDISQKYDSGTVTAIVAAASTAFGVGQAISLSIGNVAGLAKTLPSNETTVYVAFRRKLPVGVGATAYQEIVFMDGVNVQFVVRFAEDGAIRVGATQFFGTVVAFTATGVAASNTWDGWTIKLVVNNTTGSIEIRKNGNTTPVLTATGINTRNGSTNAYVNKLMIWGTQFSSSSATQYDDLFIWSGSGAAPNGFIGDPRCISDAITTTQQNQWSMFPASSTYSTGAQTTTTAYTSGGAHAYLALNTGPGSFNQITLNFSAVSTGKMLVAVYAYTGSVNDPGALLGYGELTNPGTGAQTVTLNNTITLSPSTTRFWMMINTNANFTLNATASTSSDSTATYTYASVPPTTYSRSSTTLNVALPVLSVSLTVTANMLIADATQDADVSYVYSSTVNQEDLYSFATLASQSLTPASILGVAPFCVVKRSDSGARTLSVRAKSSGTDVAVVTQPAVSNSYSYNGGFIGLDPATSAAFTISGMDALQVGVKVDA